VFASFEGRKRNAGEPTIAQVSRVARVYVAGGGKDRNGAALSAWRQRPPPRFGSYSEVVVSGTGRGESLPVWVWVAIAASLVVLFAFAWVTK
jgi:hypothetical protein